VLFRSKPIEIPVELSGDKKQQVDAFVRLLTEGVDRVAKRLREAGGEVETPQVETKVKTSVSPESIKAMTKQIEQDVQPNVTGTLTITDVKVPPINVTAGTGGNARGGLVGHAIGLSQGVISLARGGQTLVAGGVANFVRGGLAEPLAVTLAPILKLISNIPTLAGGGASPSRATGRIRGAGTGTSDSILSWLSNGEYVIDAMTTTRFGPDFFRKLQAAARGGLSLSVLRKIELPEFAKGDLVGDLPSHLLPTEPDTQKTVVAEHAVSLTINGRSVGRLRGSRESVKGLVSALKELERGVG
jgi:hypothetical protein